MKKNTHPKYSNVKVVCGDATLFSTKSTYGSDTIHVEYDFRKHPAWTGVQFSNQDSNSNSAFNKKYGAFDQLFSVK
jgi:large subunit ribosomal protein L31